MDKSIDGAEKNMIFDFHNSAIEDEVYGERLFNYLLSLCDKGKVDQEWAERVLVLSLDWPLDLKI